MLCHYTYTLKCLFVNVWFLCRTVVLVTWTSTGVLTREGSSAPSADTEVVMLLFCRSILRLRTGPRGGCSGLAEAERGHRWQSGKGHSHRRARGAQPMGGVISSGVGQQSSEKWMGRRKKRGGEAGEKKGGQMREEMQEKDFVGGQEHTQKKRFVRYSTLGRQQLDFWSFGWAGDTSNRTMISQKPWTLHRCKTTRTNLNTIHYSTTHTIQNLPTTQHNKQHWHCTHISHRLIRTLNEQWMLTVSLLVFSYSSNEWRLHLHFCHHSTTFLATDQILNAEFAVVSGPNQF